MAAQKINFVLKTSRKARRLRIAVYCDSRIVVTRPWGFEQGLVEDFIKEKTGWILDKLEYFRNHPRLVFSKNSKTEYLKNKDRALVLIKDRVEEINRVYGFRYNRINIKNQKTRWGSCSKRGNLNFNYKIVFLSTSLLNYLVAHELCHLKEFNHSEKFWALVAEAIPDYKNCRKELKNHGRI